jgi:hypothetical protein
MSDDFIHPYCQIDGTFYSKGAVACIGGSLHICDFGKWKDLSTTCKITKSNAIEIDNTGFTVKDKSFIEGKASPAVEFDVLAGTKISITSSQDGLNSNFQLRRRPYDNETAPYVKFKAYDSGSAAKLKAETTDFSYRVQCSYFGDFGSGFGSAIIRSTVWSGNDTVVEIKFARINGAPMATVNMRFSM